MSAEPDETPDPHAAIQQRLDDVCEQARATLAESHNLSLYLLALRARDKWPGATALILGWSDQGDFADIDGIEVGDEVIDNTYDDEDLLWYVDSHTELAWNLDRHGLWEAFADPTYEERWVNRIPIDDVIRLEGDAVKRLVERTQEGVSA